MKMMEHTLWILVSVELYLIILGFPLQTVNYTGFQTNVVQDTCPQNESAWNMASERLNCSKDDTQGNRYHCMPDRRKEKLLEFCYIRARVKMIQGYCIVLSDNGYVNKYPNTNCSNFINNSCPGKPYHSDTMYKYPACFQVRNGCYLSDPECRNADIEDTSLMPPSTTTESVEITSTTNLTEKPNERGTENDYQAIKIIAIVFAFIILGISSIIAAVCVYRKKRNKNQSGDDIPLLSNEYPTLTIGDVEKLNSGSVKLCITETSTSNGLNSVEWKKNGKVIQIDNVKYSGGDERDPSLVIQNACVEDAGVYHCVIIGNNERRSNSGIFLIDTVSMCHLKTSEVYKKYKIIKLTAKVEIKNGSILSKDSLTVQWYKVQKEGDRERISPICIDNAKFTLQSRPEVSNTTIYQLSIHNATEEDSGTYYFVTQDDAGGKLESERLSVYVVEDLFNKEEWENDDEVYEEPEEEFCKNIISLLDQTGMVTLVGPPGVGKTFTARHIALQMERKGWNIYQVFNMEELLVENNLETIDHSLIVFDHPFGKTSVNIFSLVYFLLHKDIFNQLFEKAKVIWTCRSSIYEEIKTFPIENLKNAIFMPSVYLGKSSGMLKEIFQLGKFQSGRTENEEFSQNNYLQKLCNHIGIYFSDVQKNMFDFYGLILLALHGNVILKESLRYAKENLSQAYEKINLSKEDFTERIKSLFKTSRYIGRKRIGKITVYFCKHDCILDAFFCHISKTNPLLFLKCAENEVLCSCVCPFSANTGECWKLLDKEQYPLLSKTLFEYLISDDMCAMSNVIKVPYWVEDGFTDVFLNVLSQNRLTEVLFKDRTYPFHIANHATLRNDKKTKKHCDALWNETEMLRFELLFDKLKGNTGTSESGFTILSTNFTYWIISYGKFDTIDQMLKLALEPNEHTDVDANRCITLACYRSVDVVVKVLQYLKKPSLKDVRFSKKETLFFKDDAIILPLHVAVARGNKELVHTLVEKEVFVNGVDHKNRSPLLVAIEKENTEITKMLLDMEDVDVNIHDCENRNPLHLATVKGNEEYVRLLLKKDAKLNQVDNECKSPLMKALEFEHKKVVTILMRKVKKVDVNQCDAHGKTALFFAMKKGYNKVMKRLVHLGADINISDEEDKTALYVAAQNNCLSLVKYLVQNGNGSLVNKGDKHQNTPLHLAIQNDNYAMVTLLVAYNADVNVCNEASKSPLYIAIEKRVNYRIFKFLFGKGAFTPKAESAVKKPILQLAYEQKMEAFDILVRQIADLFKLGEEEKSRLCYAMERNDKVTVKSILQKEISVVAESKELKPWFVTHKEKVETFDSLVKNRADINQVDDNQRTLLSYAVERNDEKTVCLLLRKNVDVDVPDSKGMTPLHYAAQTSDQYEILKLLVNAHASINVSDKKGQTPLHIASERGYLEVVEHLYREGAVLTKEDLDKKTALRYAVENQRMEVIKYLAKNGAD